MRSHHICVRFLRICQPLVNNELCYTSYVHNNFVCGPYWLCRHANDDAHCTVIDDVFEGIQNIICAGTVTGGNAWPSHRYKQKKERFLIQTLSHYTVVRRCVMSLLSTYLFRIVKEWASPIPADKTRITRLHVIKILEIPWQIDSVCIWTCCNSEAKFNVTVVRLISFVQNVHRYLSPSIQFSEVESKAEAEKWRKCSHFDQRKFYKT